MTLHLPPRGRGTASNPHNRFAPTRSQVEDDGWFQAETPPCRATEVRAERAKTVITRNQSPDVGFDRSVNPYRGCEHGCTCSVNSSIEKQIVLSKISRDGIMIVMPI